VYPEGLLDTTYNTQALKEMIGYLVAIENESVAKTISKALDDANKVVDTGIEWLDKANSFVNKFLTLLGDSNNGEENENK
jgi:hypothetical protein